MSEQLKQGETNAEASLDSAADQREAGDTDVNKGTDSSADAAGQPDKKVEKSLEQTLQERIDQDKKEELTSSEDEAEDGGVSKTNETKEESEKTDETKTDEDKSAEKENAEDNASDVEKKPVPYDRFEKVVAERNDKVNEVARLAPLAKRQEVLDGYRQQNNISDNDFVEAMELAALLKSNPEEFAKKITPILEGIGVMTGNKLPADLQEQATEVDENVASGALSKESGERIKNSIRETAKLRAQLKFDGERGKHAAKQTAETQQRQFVDSIQSAWTGWAQTVTKKDPSFKPKTNGSPDGPWEFVNDKITAMASQTNQDGSPVHPIRSAADAVKLAELAYKSVSESFKGFRTRPTIRKAPLQSNGSQLTSGDKDPLKASTLEEAMAIGADRLRSGKRDW